MIKYSAIILLTAALATHAFASDSGPDIIERNNKFSFSIFSKMNESEDSNIFISPFSITTALSMAYDGAMWMTAFEMRRVLHYHRDRKVSHEEFTELLKFYRNLKHGFLSIANAAVAQENYDFKTEYFDKVEKYGAILKTANFRLTDDRELARKQINKWVAENTNDKIEELLDESALNELTRLVLLNAIHFKADWKTEFSEDYTTKNHFFSGENTFTVDFMNIRNNFNYYQNDEIQIIELPYKDDIASMYILLPTAETDFADFINKLSLESFNFYLEEKKNVSVELSLPKFKMETDYELKDVLIKMGIVRAFNVNANFSGMTGKTDLMIDEVIHKAFIEVDEKGTEAAAATAVIMREKSAPKSIAMNVNRPFVFIIKENTRNSILFMGKLVNP